MYVTKRILGKDKGKNMVFVSCAMNLCGLGSRIVILSLATCLVLSPEITLAGASETSPSSAKAIPAPQLSVSANLKQMQERGRARARQSGSTSAYVVGDEKTCFDPRRKQERPCGDYEDLYDSGQSDGQKWFNSGQSYGNNGKLLPAAEQFAPTDELYRKHCSGETRSKSGFWTLEAYSSGFSIQVEGWSNESLNKFRTWAESQVESSGGHWAQAEYWYSYAWHARGARYAADVPEAAWQLFRERLAKADASLKLAAERPLGCPLIQQMRISLMHLSGQPKVAIKKEFIEAQRLFPEFHPLYVQMAQVYPNSRWMPLNSRRSLRAWVCTRGSMQMQIGIGHCNSGKRSCGPNGANSKLALTNFLRCIPRARRWH